MIEAPSLQQMAVAVGDLVRLERSRLQDTEFLIFRYASDPMNEIILGGWRTTIERADGARELMTKLLPHQAEIERLLGPYR
jgi:hypothetical protein